MQPRTVLRASLGLWRRPSRVTGDPWGRLREDGELCSKFDPSTPLGRLFITLKVLGISQGLHKRAGVSLYFGQYELDNQSCWPAEGTLGFNILRDLKDDWRRVGEGSEIQRACLPQCAPALCHFPGPHLSWAREPRSEALPVKLALSQTSVACGFF